MVTDDVTAFVEILSKKGWLAQEKPESKRK
jgi:hypothetical protein